jgi:hypothetical protein
MSLDVTRAFNISDHRIRTIAALYFAVGMLHGVFDPAISYLGVEVFGVVTEANPLIRSSIRRGLSVFVLIHLLLYLFIGVAYVLTVQLMIIEFERGIHSTYYAAVIGLALFIAWGTWLNVRNAIIIATNL